MNSLGFQTQRADATLAQGLDEFYSAMPDLLAPRTMNSSDAELFGAHDATHVIFGCDTSLRGELLNDAWTLFGTDVGLLGYVSYLKSPTARKTLALPGFWETATTFVSVIPDWFRVFRLSRQMKRKWKWGSQSDFMARSLADIRDALGIRVL